MSTSTIVFIHGLHENSTSWSPWKTFFGALGYDCHSPDYPFHNGDPCELRQNPNPGLINVDLNDVVEHHAKIVDDMGGISPILIGHSMGALVVQKLIQAGKGSRGVCIASAPPRGIWTLRWSFFSSNFGIVNPIAGNTIHLGSKRWFHRAICNTLTRRESDELYDRTVVPESRRIPRSSRFGDGAIDFRRPHKPLLFIGAENDRIIPVELNKKNAAAYTDASSVSDFRVFNGRSHCICAQTGWQEVAQYVQYWLTEKS